MSEGWNVIGISEYASKSINPLRKMKFEQTVEPNPSKSVITLQIGDPTVFGNFPPARECLEAIKKSVDLDTFPYHVGHGKLEARQAVAEYSKHQGNVTADDVVLTSGCSNAIEMCVLSLVSPGETLLIPRPCYNYRTLTDGMGIVTKFYNLDSSKNWDVDLKHLESLIDAKTKAILVNNPGNPCGNVYSKEHMLDILNIAERHRVPIISDEVYEFFAFPGVQFHSFASLSKNVPILTCSALSKRFMMPGIRMGWIIVNDRHGALKVVKQGLHNITGRILGPNSTVQHALPEILRNTLQKFFDGNVEKIFQHAKTAVKLLKQAPGLVPIEPKGAMYLMIKVELEKFPKFATCREFAEALIAEQSVLLFPGFPCFNFPGFLRIVLTVPEDLIIEACGRIIEFCNTHIQH